MAVGLELRIPLLDHRVVEAAAEVEERQRFQPIGGKQLLRKLSLAGLDPALFSRPKSGFVLPIASWLQQELRPAVDAILSDQELCRSAGLRPEAVSALWEAFQAGAPGIYWSRVWSLYVLLCWFRRHQVSL
jgi:asparagine synthase (glutamine-hydrolysing)